MGIVQEEKEENEKLMIISCQLSAFRISDISIIGFGF